MDVSITSGTSGIVLLLVAISLLSIIVQLKNYGHNKRIAAKIGLPMRSAPVSPMQASWLILEALFGSIIQMLPDSLLSSWYPLCTIPNYWKFGYEPFSKCGSDTFMSVSPSHIIVHTCDKDVANQIQSAQNRDALIKPPELVGIVNALGPSVVGTNFAKGRRYRKIAAPALGHATNRCVWQRTLEVVRNALQKALETQPRREDVSADLSLVTLKVMCNVCYGKNLDDEDDKAPGLRYGFSDCIATVMACMSNYLLTPRFLVERSPFETHSTMRDAFHDWKVYMKNMWSAEIRRQAGTCGETDINILSSIVAHGPKDERTSLDMTSKSALTLDEVFGNLFIFLVAGHETSSSTLTYAFYLLACHQDIQTEVQKFVDCVVGEKDPQNWVYEEVFPKLWDGILGAVVKETLRIWPVIPFIPKKVVKDTVLTVDGSRKILPAGSFVFINVAAIQRNPKYWPHEDFGHIKHNNLGKTETRPYPNTAFNPHAWLTSDSDGRGNVAFDPPPGSFQVFADGPRHCMGRRFAESEIVAILVWTLSRFSIKLDTAADSGPQYDLSRHKAMRQMTDVHFEMSLKPKTSIPLRFSLRKRMID